MLGDVAYLFSNGGSSFFSTFFFVLGGGGINKLNAPKCALLNEVKYH